MSEYRNTLCAHANSDYLFFMPVIAATEEAPPSSQYDNTGVVVRGSGGGSTTSCCGGCYCGPGDLPGAQTQESVSRTLKMPVLYRFYNYAITFLSFDLAKKSQKRCMHGVSNNYCSLICLQG